MDTSIFDYYKTEIQELLQVDKTTINVLEGEFDRLSKLSLLVRHPFLFYFSLSIITGFIYRIFGIRRKVSSDNEDFFFVSCPDTIFRTKTINLIASPLKYSIIYLPNYHVHSAIKYHNYFKTNNINTFFPTISLRYVLNAWQSISDFCKKNSIKDGFNTNKLIYILATFIIYDSVVKDYLNNMNSFKGKWIFEHQKFYFIAAISNVRSRGYISTLLQHGIIFSPVYDSIPLFCDRVLCCSKREKKIYLNNGIEQSRIIVLGAPLQTLQKCEIVKQNLRSHNLLILLTIIVEENVQLIKEILGFIKNNYDDVLIRLRPRSMDNDLLMLGDSIEGFTQSKRGISISEDIKRCNKVISFSEDANIEVIKYNKPFVYIWTWSDGEEKYVKDVNCATKDNYESEIRKLMESVFYSSFDKKKYEEILGENSVPVIRQKFVSYIQQH